MTAERAHAYRRVVRTLNEPRASNLLAPELDRIRRAADSLVFSRDMAQDVAARDALEDIERLCNALIESERWEYAAAKRLADDVSACGPALMPGLRAA
jgi:hypothetical protein